MQNFLLHSARLFTFISIVALGLFAQCSHDGPTTSKKKLSHLEALAVLMLRFRQKFAICVFCSCWESRFCNCSGQPCYCGESVNKRSPVLGVMRQNGRHGTLYPIVCDRGSACLQWACMLRTPRFTILVTPQNPIARTWTEEQPCHCHPCARETRDKHERKLWRRRLQAFHCLVAITKKKEHTKQWNSWVAIHSCIYVYIYIYTHMLESYFKYHFFAFSRVRNSTT